MFSKQKKDAMGQIRPKFFCVDCKTLKRMKKGYFTYKKEHHYRNSIKTTFSNNTKTHTWKTEQTGKLPKYHKIAP